MLKCPSNALCVVKDDQQSKATLHSKDRWSLHGVKRALSAPCVNKEGDQQCVEWASRGECDLNSNFMHPNCRKACGLCSGGSGSGTTDQGAGSKPKPGKTDRRGGKIDLRDRVLA